MLTLLFALSALILATAVVRRPRNRWQRAAAALAGFLMLAVLAAWGIEYLAQSAKATGHARLVL